MSTPAPAQAGHRRGAWLKRREFQSYVLGLVLALALTLAAFALVHWHARSLTPLYVVIGVLALLQMIVHFRCFLHIGLGQKREDLQLILFSALLLIIVGGGTVWIMWNLAARMAMPMHP